jgi:hypothetical protein
VEERVHGRERRREVVLFEADALRGGCDHAGAPVRRWEAGAARLLVEQGSSGRILVIGAGAAALPALLPAGFEAQVAEPNPVVAELAREHLPLNGRVATPFTGPCDLRDAIIPRGPGDAVVLDASAWGGREPVPQLPVRTLDALARSLEPRGLFVVGGVRLSGDAESPALDRAMHGTSAAGFAPAIAYGRDDAADQGLLVLRRPESVGSGPRAPEGWRALGSSA